MRREQRSEKNFISVIIPTFRQEKTIAKNIIRIEKVLKQLRHPFEIIVVVDGMVDKTFSNAKKVKSKHIKIFGYEKNHGKGHAIRYGMVRSKGNVVGFIDAGMDLNPNGLSILLEHFQWYNADIIIGSKRHPVSKITYPFNRKIISFLSQLLIKILFGLNVKDTQVGMKFFKREVIEDVMQRLLVKEFAFDIEILVVAYHLGYKRIFEAPVELKHKFTGSILSEDLFKFILKTFIDTLAVFYRLKILKYYDDQSKKKWKFDPDLNFRINLP